MSAEEQANEAQETINTLKSIEKRERKAEETFYQRKRCGRKWQALKEWAQVARPRTLIEGLNLTTNFCKNTNRRFEANN